MNSIDVEKLAWDKMADLLPAIIQNQATGQVLMLGYMNREALQQTIQSGKVTFYSRSKQRLWTKGEISGHELIVASISIDCDQDTLLITARPLGPTCHLGTTSCFGDQTRTDWAVIQDIETRIATRQQENTSESYTAKLFTAGLHRIAQKVGEEGVEVALAALVKDNEEMCGEIADLIFHLLILLKAKQLSIHHVIEVLKKRYDKVYSQE